MKEIDCMEVEWINTLYVVHYSQLLAGNTSLLIHTGIPKDINVIFNNNQTVNGSTDITSIFVTHWELGIALFLISRVSYEYHRWLLGQIALFVVDQLIS